MKQFSEMTILDDSDDDCSVCPEQHAVIKEKLIELRSSMLFSAMQSNVPLCTGSDLATGFPTSLIDVIVDNCHKIHTETDLDDHSAVWHLTKDIM